MLSKLEGKKVIYLFTPGPIGGAEKIVLFGVKALIEEKIEVEIWIIKEERVPHIAEAFIKLLNAEGIKPKVFSTHQIYDRGLLKGLKASFSETRPYIIHAHGFKAAFYAHFSSPQSAKLVVTHHGKTGHTLKVKIYEFIEDQIMKRSDAVIAVSQDMKRVLSKSGINKNKIMVVENFMTTKILPKKSTDTMPLKLLFVGRLSPEKGCSVLIDAMKLVKKDDFCLTILGEGMERENLQQKVKDLELSGAITFTGFKQNVNEYLSVCDAVVMPSFREGQPLTLIEACCMGLPVVASNVGGIPELVMENQNGHFCAPGNPQDLSQALIKLLSNIKALRSSAEALSPGYIERFSSRAWAKNTISIYETVLSQL
jgi:glycosyltransferase involved in cell wall biosynthesis